MVRPFQTSGDPEIDAVRREVVAEPTTPETYPRRVALLTTWMHLLQRQGYDLVSFIPAQDALRQAVGGSSEAVSDAVAAAYPSLEATLASGAVQPEIPGEEAGPPETPGRDWPVYGGDVHHTAATEEAGPCQGRVAWRFPIGLGWYARPLVEGHAVVAASPGIRTLAMAFDLDSGRRLWTCRRPWTVETLSNRKFGHSCYTTPGVASTPVRSGDALVLNEYGAQSRDAGRRWLTWIDPASGTIRKRVPAGRADYRIGHTPLAGDDRWLILPDGEHRIQTEEPRVIGNHRVACHDAATGDLLWRFHVGPLASEPVLHDGLIHVGTSDGMVFCLRAEGATAERTFGFADLRRVVWSVKAGGAVNSPVTVADGVAVFGSNDGVLHAVDAATGEGRWTCPVPESEPRSFRFFSRATVAGGTVYVGTSGRMLHAIGLDSGRILWSHAFPDWIRGAPCVRGDRVWAAGLDGTLIGLHVRGDRAEERFRIRLGTHAVLADPVLADHRLLVTTNDLHLFAVDPETGEIAWCQPLLEHVTEGDTSLWADELAGGGFYQSKPTAAQGRVFVGGPDHFVRAVDPRTGEEIWRFELGAAVSGAPAVDGGRVFVGQQGGGEGFHALNSATGAPLWSQSVGWVWSSANVCDGKVYVPGVDGHVSCLDAATGAILWRYRTPQGCHPEPPVDRGRVFFGSWDSNLYAFDAATGRHLWQFYTGGTPDSGAPIAVDGLLYVPMGGRRLVCLDAATGALRWEHRLEEGCMNASPALQGDRIVISTSVRPAAVPPASMLRCLDRKDGAPIWEAAGGGITGPAIADGRVYSASTSDPFFRCLDLETGALLWRVRIGERVYESVPAIYGGRAFILSESGYLVAIQ